MKNVISVDSILAGAATNMCGEFCNPNEEHVKPYGNPKAVDYHFSEEKKLLHSLLISKLPEKLENNTGSLQEHELIAMIDLQRESLIPREKGTLIFNEAELHQLVIKLISEYQARAIDDMRKSIDEMFRGKS